MCTRESLFQLAQLPAGFGQTILVLALILMLTPYFAGADFGVVKIPILNHVTKLRLRWLGPLVMLAVLGAFPAVWPLKCPKSCSVVSAVSQVPAVLDFENLSGKTVRFTWRTYEGQDSLPFVLQNGSHEEQPTFVNHGWCVSDAATGAFMMDIVVSQPLQRVVIR